MKGKQDHIGRRVAAQEIQWGLRPVLTEDELERTLAILAYSLTAHYQDKTPIVVGVMNGAVQFAADMLKLLSFPVEYATVDCQSYGFSGHSSGRVKINWGRQQDVEGRHLLILDTVVETGSTIHALKQDLQTGDPASVRVCCLVLKDRLGSTMQKPEYVGLHRPVDEFLVGYGLDYKGFYRNWPRLCRLARETDTRGEGNGNA